MESTPSKTPPPANNEQIPADLLQKLHDANNRFHEARTKLEAVLSDNSYRHQERINQSENDVRQAESDLEAIDSEIRKHLGPPQAP